MKIHREGVPPGTVGKGRGRLWALGGTLAAVVDVVGHAEAAVEGAVDGVECLALDRRGF